MKSKYAELFTAKLNNMDLVLFEKHKDWDEWALAGDSDRYFMVSDNFEYFLCLPQHKEAVLNCLNGGESQVASISSGWLSANCGDPVEWGGEWWYMNPNGESRIKPKKEKRWILYSDIPFSMEVFMHEKACDLALASQSSFNRKQKIEIEVEV